MSQLVTGEAVVVEVRLARLASRGVALVLDLLVQLSILVVGVLGLSLVDVNVDEALSAAISLVVVIGVLVGYPVVFETLTRGRSLGKLALGLRVVRDDGGPIRFRHALMRGLGGVVDFWLTSGSAAVICSLANSRGKRLGDLMAGTLVVRERMPAQGGPVAQMPPWLAGWASTLDVSRIPDDLALAVRQFLSRSGELDQRVRSAMGNRLLAGVEAATGTPRPPQMPPDDYLAAVLAERRRRELARMAPPQPAWSPSHQPAPYAPPQPSYAPPQPSYAPPQPSYLPPPSSGPPAAPAPTPSPEPRPAPSPSAPDDDGFRPPA